MASLDDVVTTGRNILNAINSLNTTIGQTFPQFVAAPPTASSAGVAGQVAYDTGFFYVCVSSNTWKRTALSTF